MGRIPVYSVSSFVRFYCTYKAYKSSTGISKHKNCDHDRIVVGFTATYIYSYAISAYYQKRCEFESRSWRGVIDTTLCDRIVTGRWFSLGTPVSSTNKTSRHDISEILLKVELNTVTLTHDHQFLNYCSYLFML
jgi:hypothetical protein